MGVSYDASNKKWSFTPDATLSRQSVNYPGQRYMNVTYDTRLVNRNQYAPTNIRASVSTTPDLNATRSFEIPIEQGSFPSYMDRLRGHLENNLGKTIAYSNEVQAAALIFGSEQPGIERQLSEAKNNERINNEIIDPHNAEVQKRNDQLPQIQATINSTKGDDYVSQREILKQFGVSGLEDNFKTFYLTEKLQQWDPSLGAKPLYGDFDSTYYQNNNPDAAQKWNEAVNNDDLDITARYGKDGYYLWHYTVQGKPAGKRGNAPEETEAASRYIEERLTDQELQDVRALQLGVDMNTSDARLLSVPYIQQQFEAALDGDPYWKQMAKDNFLSIDTKKPEEFAALFRLSQRPEDKEVSFNYQLNTGYGLTELEDAINQAIGEKATVDVKRFGALTQNVLKDTIEEMKKAKEKEQVMDLLSGFGSFGEITNINKSLTDSILKDTGVGGILSFTGGGKTEESLEKALQGITGVQNNVTYNWQQWFDDTLKKRYEQDLELGYSTPEAQSKIQIGADFAKEFIEKYLQPRFDTSRSMDEFVEYLDVRQEEQNPFQTQDLVNAVSQVANLKAQIYLDQLKQISDRYFDPEFYFNPTGNKAREANYLTQATQVNADWESAKNGDPYWAQQAYRFGVDVNNKAQFAKLHFQIKGQGLGYDAAEDILNAGKVSDQIYTNILPALKEEALEQGSVFGQFITPEEFADEMLQGADPGNRQEWDELLKRYGLTDFKGTVDELKEYIAETLRTGSAQRIREEIKYLNEKRQKPTQEKLGLTYIERPEDFKDEQAAADTELYKVFQSAGYQGTEDEFYETMFPDVDRTEQQLLTKAGGGKGLEFINFDTSDPFAALGSIESFFAADEEEPVDEEKKSSSFFSLDSEDEDTDYKSPSGEKFLSEFTSFFKGFS